MMWCGAVRHSKMVVNNDDMFLLCIDIYRLRQACERHRGLPGHRARRFRVLRGHQTRLRRRGVSGGHQWGQGHRQERAGAVAPPVLLQNDEPQVGDWVGGRRIVRSTWGVAALARRREDPM